MLQVTRVTAACILPALLIGCASQVTTRAAAPRMPETIFSPLPLPTPNALRTQTGRPGPDYWQQRADYRIHATLHAEARVVSASGVIRYHNHSPDELTYLWLHLEQNLYLPDSRGGQRGVGGSSIPNPDVNTRGVEVTHVRVNGREATMQVYDTVARLDLPEPLAAREGVVEIEIGWRFEVPRFGDARMGWEQTRNGTIFQIGQWYPAVCKYDDVHGWNTLPYLGQGEFYTDFGTFDVRLSVPRDHLVAASGVLMNPAEVLTAEQRERLKRAAGSPAAVIIRGLDEVGDAASRPAGEGPLTWRFVAHDVRSFAWASSPAFIWDAAGIAERGSTPSERDGSAELPSGTLVQSFYPVEATPLWFDNVDMLRMAVLHFGGKWGVYPYPTATNVNGVVGGMEYPMIVFCSERLDERDLFEVTAHEAAHWWFPMTVNTDERRHAWFDEGFVTFMTLYAMRERRASWFDPRGWAASVAEHLGQGGQPAATRSDEIVGGAYGVLAYDRVAWALYCLREKVLGPQRFDAAMHEYIRAWAFQSPQPSDFFRVMENAAGCDLAWFWRGWLYEDAPLDQAVVGVRHNGDIATATFENRGAMVMPLEFLVRYSDGSSETRTAGVEVWYASDRCELSWATGGRRVRELIVDPEELLPDVNRANNRRSGG
ncbi:MAG: M1 family metallopeptidase [Phycisphaerales bacterium]|nr:M1 family metallopeptidase [Phycisphaerales bacterium]